jgi:nickel/cobalt transporter (NiCoT) family protein
VQIRLGPEDLDRVLVRANGALSQTSGFWGFMYNFNIDTAGFVIVGMFIVTWVAAILIWHFGRIEQRWTARLQAASTSAPATGLTEES